MLKHVVDKHKPNELVHVIDLNLILRFLNDVFFSLVSANSTLKIYDADVNALKNSSVGRTLVEARKLGRIVTPKQYRCTFCVTGVCGIIVDSIQCFCGPTQCPPVPTTGMIRTKKKQMKNFIVIYFQFNHEIHVHQIHVKKNNFY